MRKLRFWGSLLSHSSEKSITRLSFSMRNHHVSCCDPLHLSHLLHPGKLNRAVSIPLNIRHVLPWIRNLSSLTSPLESAFRDSTVVSRHFISNTVFCRRSNLNLMSWIQARLALLKLHYIVVLNRKCSITLVRVSEKEMVIFIEACIPHQFRKYCRLKEWQRFHK